jgi:hypothetical protein
VAIGRRREALRDTTLAQYRADLERRLDRLLAAPEPKQGVARCLFRAMSAFRAVREKPQMKRHDATGPLRRVPLRHPSRRALHQQR